MSKDEHKAERRTARRFEVSWDVTIEGAAPGGKRFNQAGRLQNLSSQGAFFLLPKRVRLGKGLEVEIRVPMKEKSWMKYSARVVRVQEQASGFGVAVNFDTTRPIFKER
jgi:PilZ domain